LDKKKINRRHLIQALGVLVFNGNLKGFLTGKIYQGKLKNLCVPVLNCYACPGAVGSCPIGSLQAISNHKNFNLSFYVLGLIGLFGILLGRFFCGYLCPFGFFQDLLAKIPSKKIRIKNRFNNIVRYSILIIMVFLIPIFVTDKFGMGDPVFCKYICPSGTLLGAFPLLTVNPALRGAIGSLFFLKVGIFVAISVLSIFIFRFFCRLICPLGALLGLFNPVSFYRFRIDDSCISCGKCERACKMGINPVETPNSTECIRCDDCVKECPVSAIKKEFKLKD